MRDWIAVQERFLRDPFSVRLGGIAANLARVASLAESPGGNAVVDTMLTESKYMIEWTALDGSIEVQADLVELQVQLALWGLVWEHSQGPEVRQSISRHARTWSNRVLAMSGLLGDATPPD